MDKTLKLCIDCLVKDPLETHGYIRRVLDHAVTLGARVSITAREWLEWDSLFGKPRYVFVLYIKKQHRYVVAVDTHEKTWWEPGMRRVSPDDFLALMSLPKEEEDMHGE